MSQRSVPATDRERQHTTTEGSKTARLAAYLRDEAEESGGELYVKAKFVADDLELSAKEIGARMLQLQNSVSGLTIEKWGYSDATTWRVETHDGSVSPGSGD